MRWIRFTAAGKIAIAALLGLLTMGMTMPSLAQDCATTTQAAEKRICAHNNQVAAKIIRAHADLRAANAKMNAAYTALLNAAPDAEIRAALVRSQRRWLQACNEAFIIPYRDSIDEIHDQLLTAIEDRTRHLADHSSKGFIANARANRRWIAKHPGPYTSIAISDCYFHDPFSPYTCRSSAISAQYHSRICAWYETFNNTDEQFDYYGISTVRGGKVKLLATCDGRYLDCLGDFNSDSASEGWTRAGAPSSADFAYLPQQANQPKFDAEYNMTVGLFADFFSRCLTDPKFPPGLH